MGVESHTFNYALCEEVTPSVCPESSASLDLVPIIAGIVRQGLRLLNTRRALADAHLVVKGMF